MRLLATTLLLILAAVSASAQTPRAMSRTPEQVPTVGAVTTPNPLPPRLRQPVVNRLIVLLEDDVFLEEVGDISEWISPAFDSSQFNQLVLKVDSQAVNGSISCSTEWSFGEGDPFVAGTTTSVFIGDDPQVQRLGQGLTPQPVAGLQARVRCSISGPNFGGDDSTDPATGVVSDVKVLLRRV